MGLVLQSPTFYDNGGGLDLKSSPTKVSEDDSSDSLNVDYSTDGAFFTRNGSTIMNAASGIPSQMSGAPRTLALFDYEKSDGTEVQVLVAGTAIKHSLTTPTDAVTGLTDDLIPDLEFQVTGDDEFLFFGNGTDDNLKFDGTDWTNWSIEAPSTTATIADSGATGSLAAGTYSYYITFARLVDSIISQESDLSPVTSNLTIAVNHEIDLTDIPVSADSQVNARVLYRIDPTDGIYYRVHTIEDNTTTTYTDDNAVGTIEADYDNQAAPNSPVFEEYLGRMYMVSGERLTDVYFSKINHPWNVPSENVIFFDGPVKCIKRVYGVLIIATDKSIWVLNGDAASNSPVRISSKIGILNNRCAVGESILYILGTNRKFYTLSPTDFGNQEIRISEPLSTKVDTLFGSISASTVDHVCMEYYTKADVAKVMISVPYVTSTNNAIIVYNETQSLAKQKPVFQLWDNIKASALKQFNISNVINIYSGDYNGFLWKLDDESKSGDGAEVNGTVTSATATTLTDTSQTWDVDAYVGMTVRIISGTNVDEVLIITTNTADTLTVDGTWATTPDTTSTFTVGGYDSYHFTNWKSVTGSYDTLKQLWYFMSNLNASGDYEIDLIIQFDFDTSETNATSLTLSLTSGNSIWGSFIWGEALWGAQSVFQDRIRTFGRFRAVRFGFKNREAGQPFQVNGYTVSVQDKGLFYGAAA